MSEELLTEAMLDELDAYEEDLKKGSPVPPHSWMLSRSSDILRTSLERLFWAYAPNRRMPGLEGYEEIEEFARGGYGVIYRAKQKEPARDVAIKVVWASSVASREQFEIARAEAEKVAALEHPNIVPVYEARTTTSYFFYSTKFFAAGNLESWLSQRTFPHSNHELREAVQLLTQVADAVAFAHDRGVIHCDLKPENILIDGEEGKWQAIVSDFGLSQYQGEGGADGEQTEIVGTPRYMAPEQAGLHSDLTTKVDVFGLGATLYRILSGGPPHSGSTALETMVNAKKCDIEPPSGETPPELSAICMKCLSPDPSERYESMQSVADDLQRWLIGEPVSALQPSTLSKAIWWHKSNPWRALALHGSLIAAAAILFTAIGWAIDSDTQARNLSNALTAKTREFDRADKTRKILWDVTESFEKLSEEFFIELPASESVRHEFLTRARDIYNELVSQPGQETELRLDRAKAFGRLAMIEMELGQPQASLKLYDQALAILQELASESDDYRPRVNIVLCRTHRGNLFNDLGEYDSSQSEFSGAAELATKLCEQFPTETRFKSMRASAIDGFGVSCVRQGELEKAETHIREGLQLRQELQKAEPENSKRAIDAARSQGNLANVIHSRLLKGAYQKDAKERIQEAFKLYTKTIKLCESEVQKSTGAHRIAALMVKANVTKNRGQLFASIADRERQEHDLNAALEAFSEVAERHPRFIEANWQSADTCFKLAKFHEASRDYDKANGFFVRAELLYRSVKSAYPGNHLIAEAYAACQASIARFELKQGNHAKAKAPMLEAVATFQRLVDEGRSSATLDLASGHCVLGQLAKKEDDVESAISRFGRSIELLDGIPESERKKGWRQCKYQSHLERARLLTQKGKSKEALLDWTQAAEHAAKAGVAEIPVRSNLLVAQARCANLQAVVENSGKIINQAKKFSVLLNALKAQAIALERLTHTSQSEDDKKTLRTQFIANANNVWARLRGQVPVADFQAKIQDAEFDALRTPSIKKQLKFE